MADHAFYPYETAGQDFADAYIASLARMFDGTCGEGPASIAKTAGMQLAVSRYLYDLGKQTGDVKLLAQASQQGNDSGVLAGAAYELQSREAEARKKRGGADGLKPGETYVEAKPKEKAQLPLMQWIPPVTPRFRAPLHLAPMVDVLERVRLGEEVRAAISVGPRFFKTETASSTLSPSSCATIQLDALRSSCTLQTAAEKRSREIRDIYLRAGGHLNPDATSRRDWRTAVEDGGLWATSPRTDHGRGLRRHLHR